MVFETDESVLFIEVSSIQRNPYRERYVALEMSCLYRGVLIQRKRFHCGIGKCPVSRGVLNPEREVPHTYM